MAANLQPAAPQVDLNAVDNLVNVRRDLKVALEAEAKAHKAREKRYKEQIEQIDNALLGVLNDEHLPTYRSTRGGTVGTTIKTHYSVSDRPALEAWCKAQGDLSYFSNGLAKAIVEAYIKEHNALPPGVKAYQERQVTHNKHTSR